jgi:hypothetical protein
MHVSHKEDVCFVGHGDGAHYGKGIIPFLKSLT